jgi:phosphate transport system permease protein
MKATFYSLVFGVPIALLAAIYSSEFVDPAVKAPMKSLIEMMASVPSVVLGFLAGLVFAPFVEDVLPTLLAALLLIPFAFLLGAQLWQQLPHKAALQWAKYRLLAIGLMLTLGVLVSGVAGPYLQAWLFGGNFKAWLNGHDRAASGWFLLLLPLVAVATSIAVNTYVNPWLRQRFGALERQRFALLNLAKFLLVTLVAVAAAYLVALAIAKAGFDARGGLLDTYVQRNALVVGFVMGFAIIPIIYTISEDALSTVPHHLRSASLACGATPWQTTWRVVVPTAASGLFSAVMVGMGRAVGETMIMLMATGNVPLMEWNIFNGFRTLSANVAEELGEASPWSTHFRILFLTGVILLLLTLVINTAAEAIRIQFRKRASQL